MPIAEVNGQSVLFLHIPKTGGSSIERHLSSIGHLSLKGRNHRFDGIPCSSQHLHAEAVKRLFPGRTFDWAFTIVRHPLERIVSQYKFQIRKAYWPRRSLSFSLWLRYVLTLRKLNPYYRDNHFRPQVEFEGFAAEVLRFEDGINECIALVDEHFGLARNNSPVIWEKRSQPVVVNVSKYDMEAIREVYGEDFRRYGYK